MDPITAALVSALATGLVSGVTKIGEGLVGDAYQALKSALSRKFGKKSKVARAVKELETDPKSVRAQEALSNSVKEERADRDQEPSPWPLPSSNARSPLSGAPSPGGIRGRHGSPTDHLQMVAGIGSNDRCEAGGP